jgi:2-(3-amino-3-carboxypropyl)histidine synthase
VALQLPEGLLMYATCIGDILRKFAYAHLVADDEKPLLTISILGDVTYGACCIDDLTALSLDVDLLVHYGHSCLVPTTITAVPCLYVFVEIRVDVQHLVDCVRLTFEHQGQDEPDKARVVECAIMGTVQFRSAVVEAAQRLNQLTSSDAADTTNQDSDASSANKSTVEFQAIVPQAKPLSPGEVLGCTAPSGLAELDWKEAIMSPRERRDHAKSQEGSAVDVTLQSLAMTSKPERVMIFLADGRFHLEAAMISNPSLRALRYDPYSKTLTEEKYDFVKMKRLRREAVQKVRDLLGVTLDKSKQFRVDNISCAAKSSEDIANSLLQPLHTFSSTTTSTITKTLSPHSKTMGIILGTLGRQGNPGILARIRSLLHTRGVRTMIVLLSEIFPKKLEMLSGNSRGGDGSVCAWVQIACPRLRCDSLLVIAHQLG